MNIGMTEPPKLVTNPSVLTMLAVADMTKYHYAKPATVQ